MTAKTATPDPQTSPRSSRGTVAEGRAEALRRAALRRRARHLMRGEGFTDEEIAIVIGSTPRGVHQSFYRDTIREQDVSPDSGPDDGVQWQD